MSTLLAGKLPPVVGWWDRLSVAQREETRGLGPEPGVVKWRKGSRHDFKEWPVTCKPRKASGLVRETLNMSLLKKPAEVQK